ncbi:hypothetical protein Bca4012_026935 [Brassica carinata]
MKERRTELRIFQRSSSSSVLLILLLVLKIYLDQHPIVMNVDALSHLVTVYVVETLHEKRVKVVGFFTEKTQQQSSSEENINMVADLENACPKSRLQYLIENHNEGNFNKRVKDNGVLHSVSVEDQKNEEKKNVWLWRYALHVKA